MAGYNLLNEPADQTHERLTRFYERIVGAVRAIDPRHILFLDGNTYATEFDVFHEVWGQHCLHLPRLRLRRSQLRR